jgi:nucleoside-diphosphate-sugar epimerase
MTTVTSTSSIPSALTAPSPFEIARQSIPYLSYLTPQHESAFNKIEFVQSSLLTPDLTHAALHKDGVVWDYIFYFGLERKLGLPKQAYDLGIILPAMHLAEYAQQHGSILCVMTTSTLHEQLGPDVYAKEDTPNGARYTGHLAKFLVKLEEEMLQLSKYSVVGEGDVNSVKLIILRVAIVYGPDCYIGFSIRHLHSIRRVVMPFLLARIFKEDNATFMDRFPTHMRLSSVHARDVAKAAWHTAVNYHKQDHRVRTYNLACPVVFSTPFVSWFILVANGQLIDMVCKYYNLPLKRYGPTMSKILTYLAARHYGRHNSSRGFPAHSTSSTATSRACG